jgi:serine/threonine protein kinase
VRGGALSRLTTDHVWDRPEMQHVLTRAIGLDSMLTPDHGIGELCQNDVFLLVSDGVWSHLREYDLNYELSATALGSRSADDTARTLLQAALAAGASDNVSALVLRVDQLPEENLRDAVTLSQQLPLPPVLKAGQTIDGLLVEEQIHASRVTLLYRVRDPRSGRQLVLKTLQPSCADDDHERSAFAHEEWLAKRMVARFFPQVINHEERTYFYYLCTWHAGHTLQQHLDAGVFFTVPDVIAHGIKLVRAVGALHRRSVIHRDIKPANIHLGDDGELRVLDLGVALSGMEDEQPNAAPQAGTPSFLAPELFDSALPSRQTDLYAVGVTLYQLLTRHYPYGEIEPFQRPRFGEPALPGRYRPDLPLWLENVLRKAVAREPAMRFETAEEMLLALERGATRPLDAPPSTPLASRDPVSVWRTVAISALVLNILLLYVIVVR